MSEAGSYCVEGEIGIVTIDNPPVNSLGLRTRRAIQEGFNRFAADSSVKAIVLICGGRTFFAGADISEFGQPPVAPDLHDILRLIENSAKPVVAAIHGTALGGGYELSLVCHYRIAVPSAMVGLPEVSLGLLPGAGGTQRLPRIVGVPAALDIITGGKPIKAKKALELGMIDSLADEGKLREDAISFARHILADGKPMMRVSDRNEKLIEAKASADIFEEYLKRNARAFRGFKAPGHIVRAIQAAVDTAPDFDAGMAREMELFLELEASPESLAQRYYFFAERETVKVPDIGKDVGTLPVKSVGVIGAGTMGGGITMNFLNVGIPVVLAEMSQEALDRGIGIVRRNYENSAKKGRMTAERVEQLMALITPAIGLEALREVDLVIEAVFEQMSVKKEIFSKLDGICKPGTILASNTSFLDLDEIAAATGRPDHVVGMHFFSPANVMRLLEVVRGEKTSKEVINTAMKLGKSIGKVPVLSRVCWGFIANRIMAARAVQANELILEGPTPQDVDKAIYDYGFAMGPFQMNDLVGLDVIGRDDVERSVSGDLVKLDRLGQKKNGGYYDYDENRKASPSPVAAQVIADFAQYKGIENKGPQSDEAIVARLLYPVVNEGAKLLEEGIAIRASDIDVAAILGYNWPVYTGGPMFWADTIGLQKVVDGLNALGIPPATLLVEKAQNGDRFTTP
ncbi:3-hydroxyacyl-CoA dehydrogenase NAD-binding domain-containing protein [Novosphingobium cyanobacteriorum]|uniref:3-hydroxyacyl-CoA dehydrogenase NAD-binding domain-containing protein n=1 Tax=Novosphingobium cyanobacteriorum TaxID=3024215 RepID=A0ABT6CE54_9SPHN|nr:3-hydroxyacyl-CoA dehydrogenase NAD-binding domain-containing protein [Novosphingobium cyanobacteriorum]MDF8332199.1 3-hydroxyacyl-CoA dehydrogenase NAD-binding domain-containing protein [Novosphingobium cyanobacteriorum]